jgi:hypothetical protein
MKATFSVICPRTLTMNCRYSSLFAALCILSLFAIPASCRQHEMHVQPRTVTLMTGLGTLHHPVSAGNPQAQQFFDQGLRLIYAFNHEEAARSFQHAAELDPKLGMAYWGVAEAVGAELQRSRRS